MNENVDQLIRRATLVATRLERLTADSIYAHQASGIRRSMLRILINPSQLNQVELLQDLASLTFAGYALLEEAAEQIPDSD